MSPQCNACLPACRDVLYETGPDGQPSKVTGLKLSKAGEEKTVQVRGPCKGRRAAVDARRGV